MADLPKAAKIGLIFLAGAMVGGCLASGYLATAAIFTVLAFGFGYVILSEWK